MVPFDSLEILRAQIQYGMYTPKGCSEKLLDYTQLARARLQELNHSSDDSKSNNKRSFDPKVNIAF